MANKNLILRKLTSPYIGHKPDLTRGTVLSHMDVDNNFIFLKGEDIITGTTSGTTLILNQVNTDIIEIDLLPLLTCPDNVTTGVTLTNNSLYFDTKDTLSAYTVDLSSFLDNTDNFTTGTTLVGHSLYFDRTNALSAYTVDLSPISGDTNTDNFTTGTTLVGGTAFFDRTDALSAYTLDLTPFTANTNYYTTGATIIGGSAYFDRTDALSAFTLDITSLTGNTNYYTTGATLAGTTVYYDRTDGLSAYTVDLSPFLDNTDNFTTGTTLIGHSLYFDRTNALSAYTVDLSPISGDTNTDNFTTGTTLVGGTAFFDRTDALSAYTLDLTPFTADTNYYTTGSTIIGNTAYFDRNDTLSAFTLDVSSLTANTNDYTTGATLNGTEISYDRTDGLSAYTVDLSSIIPNSASDYGNIIFVSEVGPTGDVRNDVIGDILKPVDLEWASSIAQSGDTIHVKAGSYTSTTTSSSGLTVNGVNHYFEENSKVYKSSAGPVFRRLSVAAVGGYVTDGGNVYGNGSFYTSGSCDFTFSYGGWKSSGLVGFYYNPSIFEFDECISSSNTSIITSNNGVDGTGDVIIRGKTRVENSSGHCINNNTSSIGEKITIDCPYIGTTLAGSHAIWLGFPSGGAGDAIINSDVIYAIGTPGDISKSGGLGILCDGGNGKIVCNASYVTSIQTNGNSVWRSMELNVERIDDVYADVNIVKCNGHIGHIWLNNFTNAYVELCDSLESVNTIENSTANITMSNITGSTTALTGKGTFNLSSSDIVINSSTENPNFALQTYTTGPRNYIVTAGTDLKVNLLGRWDNGDTFTHGGGTFTLNISSDAYVKETTFTSQVGSTGKLQIKGKTEDCEITHSGGTIVIDGATMLVSNPLKQIITAPNASSEIKVYTGGLNTNKFGPFSGSGETLKVTVAGISAALTVNTEPFVTTVAATAAAAAAELVTLINASGTVNATASQDTPGVDTYIYVTSDIIGTLLTMAYGFNTILDSQISNNSYPITDVVGGTVIEDTEID